MYDLAVRQNRRLRLLVAAAALGCVLAGAFAGRLRILRGLGEALVVDEPLHTADAIVIAIDAGDAGVLEAADLVQSGIASRVVVLADPPALAEREFARRGLPSETAVARAVRQLRVLGVTNIDHVARAVAGTEDAASLIPDFCDQNKLNSIVVVSNADHTRRLRRVLKRAMSGRPTRVTVRRARYSDFSPERWWQTRGGVRTEIVELEKLLFDLIRHPIS